MKTELFSVDQGIDKEIGALFDLFYNKIITTDTKVVSYFESYGGLAKVAASIVRKIEKAPPTVVFEAYAGIACSAAAFIFSAFDRRVGFKDSSFLIHGCIPPKDKIGLPEYDDFDNKMWKIMSKHMLKVSPGDLALIASKNEIILADEAKEIGLIHEIHPGSYLEYKEKIRLGRLSK